MDEQRALIEKLMGQNSNLGAGESNKRRLRFDDNEVDKNYLVLGFSPHDALQNTRSSLGVTHKTCDPDCKAQWDALPQEEKDGYGYELQTFQFVDRLVNQCDRKVEKNRARISLETRTKHDQLERHAGEVRAQAEEVAEMGGVRRAFLLCNSAEELLKSPAQADAAEQTVCGVTGNFVSEVDLRTKSSTHYEGRMYKGWKQIREGHAELKRRLEAKGVLRAGQGDDRGARYGGDRGMRYGGDRGARYAGDRSRERVRGRERSRERSPERSRERSRDRGRDDRSRRRRSRSRDRSRSHSRSRRRHRRRRSRS